MKLQVIHIANTVYLSVHNKSSHCHVTDSMENISLHKHPICLLVMKMLFSGNAAAAFYMLSCSHAHVIWKDAVFITEKYHWRLGSFIKSVSPAGSLHVLTTSWKAAIINLRPHCVWPQWCMAETAETQLRIPPALAPSVLEWNTKYSSAFITTSLSGSMSFKVIFPHH